jgi:hypothetical protein
LAESLFLFLGSLREVVDGGGLGPEGNGSIFVLSAVTGMMGISLGPWLGEVAVSGEEGVSRMTSCSGSGEAGGSMSGEAGVSAMGEEVEVASSGGVDVCVSGEGICSGEAVCVSGDIGDSAILRLGGESVGEDQGGRAERGVSASPRCESGSWGLLGDAWLTEPVNTFGDVPRPDLPPSLDFRLSSLFFFSASESLGLSTGLSRGMDFVFGAGSVGIVFGADDQGVISGDRGVSCTGERGVSGWGERGMGTGSGPLASPGLLLLPHRSRPPSGPQDPPR